MGPLVFNSLQTNYFSMLKTDRTQMMLTSSDRTEKEGVWNQYMVKLVPYTLSLCQLSVQYFDVEEEKYIAIGHLACKEEFIGSHAYTNHRLVRKRKNRYKGQGQIITPSKSYFLFILHYNVYPLDFKLVLVYISSYNACFMNFLLIRESAKKNQ